MDRYSFDVRLFHPPSCRFIPALLDPFSSARVFDGWATPHGYPPPREPLPVASARTWLVREGWAKAGPSALDDVPRSAP